MQEELNNCNFLQPLRCICQLLGDRLDAVSDSVLCQCLHANICMVLAIPSFITFIDLASIAKESSMKSSHIELGGSATPLPGFSPVQVSSVVSLGYILFVTKCEFGQPALEFLGDAISPEGIRFLNHGLRSRTPRLKKIGKMEVPAISLPQHSM